MNDRIILAGSVRTPIGKFGGVFSSVSAVELGGIVIREALSRAGIPSDAVDEVLMGCVLQAGLGQNPARQASIRAGLSESVPAVTVNMVCGSSLKCVNIAASLIASGKADVVVAGGMENMSAAPFLLSDARFGYRMNNGVLRDSMISDALWDAFYDCHMGVTAENIAEQYGISREEQDEFAAQSQHKCEAARKGRLFDGEIIPVEVKKGKETLLVSCDESPRDGVTLEKLSTMKPSFKPDGTVTAANASSINDGAAAVVLVSERKADELGLAPQAYFIDSAEIGVSPAVMGLGAGYAAKKLMDKNGIDASALTLIEANEAFASQSIACAHIGGWDGELMRRVNVNGGAISLGHPVGASGCRILVTLIHELTRRGGGRGLATLCVGGGMGVAAMISTE